MKETPFVSRRQMQNKQINPGEKHSRAPISKIGPKIKGIRLSQDDKIKQAIRNLRKSDQAEFDTFEEADDFDVDDEVPDPTSVYEMTDMEQDYEFQPVIEKKEDEEPSAPKEAPQKEGADTPSSS